MLREVHAGPPDERSQPRSHPRRLRVGQVVVRTQTLTILHVSGIEAAGDGATDPPLISPPASP